MAATSRQDLERRFDALDRLMRRAEVQAATGLRTSSLYEQIASGRFPRPVKLNPGSLRSPVAWLESEVRAWQAARIAERDHAVEAA
jgi:prophage regulatory protein